MNKKINNMSLDKFTVYDKVLAFVIAFLMLLSCSPIVFGKFNIVFILFFVIVYFLLLIRYFTVGEYFLRRSNIKVFFISIVLFLYVAIPFRDFDRFSPSVIWFLLFSTLLMLKKNILIKGFEYFTDFLYVICLASILVLVLNSVGVSLPNVVIPRDIGGYFTSFYISVKLSGQDYSVFGVTLYRLNGVFAEPGHFGLLLCMVLFVYQGITNTLKGKIILLTCILTMSFGTFILLLGLLIKNVILERKLYLAIIIVFIAMSFLVFVPSEILARFFFDKADGTLEERTSRYFVWFYNSFLESKDVFLGMGRDVLDIHNIRNSDYRGFVVRYGFFGMFLYLIFMLLIYWDKNKSIKFLGFFYFTIVFMHRSWFVDYFVFLVFLLVLTFNLVYEKPKRVHSN